jgi:hypothetical protein
MQRAALFLRFCQLDVRLAPDRGRPRPHPVLLGLQRFAGGLRGRRLGLDAPQLSLEGGYSGETRFLVSERDVTLPTVGRGQQACCSDLLDEPAGATRAFRGQIRPDDITGGQPR